MLDSLPDAGGVLSAWRVYSQKIGRQWRRQIIHGLRAVTGAYTGPGIKLASKLARNPAKKKPAPGWLK